MDAESALKEIIDIYANMEGFKPVTAQEGYLLTRKKV